MVEDNDKDTIPPPSSGTKNNEKIDTPFPPEELPGDVVKRLEEQGVLQPSKPKADRTPHPSPKAKTQPRTPSSPAKTAKSSKSPPPVPKSPPPVPRKDPKQEEYKEKLQPLVPNMQKLFRLISVGNILPAGVSFESVRFDGTGSIYIGQLEIGSIFEGEGGEDVSVRIYLTKLNIADNIPEIIKKKFPVSESILAINRSKMKFFIVTERDISLGFAKSESDKPFLYIIGKL